ncbi:MAG: DUF1902 domain-containing protein [Hyphomicrobium sp.]|nr:DUF1902 domain-containing protein [Hyphomicrobium sp.]
MKRISIIVRANWDEEANVWIATTADVPGLATEAATVEELRSKLLVILPELVELNCTDSDLPEIPIHIIAEQSARIANPHRH